MMHPVQDAGVPVIDVDIIAHLDIPDSPSVKSKTPQLKKRIRPEKPYIRPEPLDEEIQPDAIEGDNGSLLHKNSPPAGLNGGRPADHAEDKEDSRRKTTAGDLHDRTGHSSGQEESETPLPPRNFLFDRETIEKFAKKPSQEDRTLSFDTSGFKHRGYMRLLKQKIERIWKYPEEMARRGISGDLYITFLIKQDGSLGDVRLVRTSGYIELDEAAIKALKDAEPFWPLPDNWEKNGFEIRGHFIYLPGGTYVL